MLSIHLSPSVALNVWCGLPDLMDGFCLRVFVSNQKASSSELIPLAMQCSLLFVWGLMGEDTWVYCVG